MNDSPATRTLTYRELADALGISLRAAEARARRRIRQGNWRPFKGNDGIARFVVPVADLHSDRTPTHVATHPLTSGNMAGATQGGTPPNASAVVSLTLAELAERVGRAEAERDSARAERQRIETELRETRDLTNRTIKEAAELRELVGQVEVERDGARAERQRAEAERDQARTELVELQRRIGRTEAERDGARAEREQAEQAATDAQVELAAWTAGSPLARAVRALLYRR